MGAIKNAVQGLFTPQAMKDPRQNVTGNFADLFAQSLNGGRSIGDILGQAGMIPGYKGQLTTDQNQGQTDAMQALTGQLAGMGGQGNNILQTLMGMSGQGNNLNLPPEIAAFLGGASQNSQLGGLQSLAGGNGDLAKQIQALVQGNPGQGGQLERMMGQYSNSPLQSLQGFQAQNPFINALAGSGQGSNPAISALFGMNTQTPEQTMLQQLAASGNNPFISQLAGSGQSAAGQLMGLAQQAQGGQGQNAISSLLGSGSAQQLLSGGQGSDLNSIAAAIQQAAQPGIDRGLRDLREQFSFNGLRKSTDLNSAAGQYLAETQGGLNSQIAQLAPQLAASRNSTSLGALQTLLGGAGQLGQNEQGGLAAAIQAITSAGGLSQSGVQGAATAQNQQLGTLGQILGQAGQLGQGSIASQIQALTQGGQLSDADKARLQSGLGMASDATGNQNNQLLQAMTSGAGLNLQQLQTMLGGQQNSILNALSGQQNGLQGLQGLLTSQLGAAGQLGALGQQQAGQDTDARTQQAQLLAQLFGQQQGNALNAGLGAANAFGSINNAQGGIAQLLGQLGQNQWNNQNTNNQNQYNAFTQQQSLLPQLLGFLSSTGPTQYGDSPFTTGMNALSSVQNLALGKSAK